MEINICQDANINARACRARRPCESEFCYGSQRQAASVALPLPRRQRVEIVDCVLLWPSWRPLLVC